MLNAIDSCLWPAQGCEVRVHVTRHRCHHGNLLESKVCTKYISIITVIMIYLSHLRKYNLISMQIRTAEPIEFLSKTLILQSHPGYQQIDYH